MESENNSTFDGQNIVRRAGNYGPTIWKFDYIRSLGTTYVGQTYLTRIEELKQEIRIIMENEKDHLAQLEHIDMLERLGISYHFADEIKKNLDAIHSKSLSNNGMKNNLYATSLKFKVLRKNGYLVSTEILNIFKDETGNFKECEANDVKGILCLYETSFHLVENETILEEARDFTIKHLENYLVIKKENIVVSDGQNNSVDYLSTLARHELELPLHWRMLRMEARWFIDVYATSPHMNPMVLELAKRDFNVLQSIYLDDLKHASRWWKSIGLGAKLEFTRDRVVETFLWTIGYLPEFGYCRRMLTRAGMLTIVIDDIFDVFGTLPELELFLDGFERWDINDMDKLPEYMQLCFLATFNTVNDMAYNVLKEQGLLITKYLKKLCVDLCKAYMVEAKWYYTGFTPTLQEYIDNGWASITIALLEVNLFCFITNPITEEQIQYLFEYPKIIRQSSLICRLVDDLGTSSAELERGDNPKSIQCYMHESGASEEEARQHIMKIIERTWKEMNNEMLSIKSQVLSRNFYEAAMIIPRMAMCMYQNGDGHGVHQEQYTKAKILSLFVNPIPLESEN